VVFPYGNPCARREIALIEKFEAAEVLGGRVCFFGSRKRVPRVPVVVRIVGALLRFAKRDHRRVLGWLRPVDPHRELMASSDL